MFSEKKKMKITPMFASGGVQALIEILVFFDRFCGKNLGSA
jgi:hypothetical protein